MLEFLNTHKDSLIYALIIIVVIFFLRFITAMLHKWFLKVQEKKLRGIRPSTINMLKRIINTVWLVLGILAIGFFSFGGSYESFESNFKLTTYIGFLAILVVIFASTINIGFKKSVERKIEMGEDPTAMKFARYIVITAVYTIGLLFILLAIPSLKGIAQTALGGAGIIALIAGVASQEALANLVGGVFIIAFKPFKIGDFIRLSDGSTGRVADITLRHTVLRNPENMMIVIPNAVINKEKITNFHLTDPKIRERINFDISYESDIDLAKQIIREECENHPFILDNRSAVDVLNGVPIVVVVLTSLDDSSIRLRASAWAKDRSQATALRYAVLESVKKRFDREGIDIPYPHTTVDFKDKDAFQKKDAQNDAL